MSSIKFGLLVAFVLFVFSFPAPSESSVLGVDFGSEWMKLAIVGTGSFQVVLNDQSTRKTPISITFKDGDLLLGVDAKNLVTKQPKLVYSNLLQLLGRKYPDAEIEKKKDLYFPYDLVEIKDRGVYGVQLNENITFAAEDLVGMMLNLARELASKVSKIPVKDCVITVPPFFSQHQRQAIIDAAKLGGLHVLSLINQNSATALNWGIDREFNTENATNTIFYDMGASTVTASLVSFRAIPDPKKTNKTQGQLTVEAVSWAENLGGRDFDLRLRDHFAEIANEKTKAVGDSRDIRANPRAMAKLLKEAQKVKEVLSANQDAEVSVEGLVDEFDFKYFISREKFEQLCQDLFDRITQPVSDLLTKSGYPKEEIHFFEIVGGGLRVPAVQSRLQKFLGKDLDKHLNGDESAVLGATFFGATQSASFRVKNFKFKDMTSFSVQAKISSEGQVEPLNKQADLFRAGSRVNSKKSVSFSTADEANFTISLSYTNDNGAYVPAITNLGSFLISGIPSKEQYNYTGKPKISASFRLTYSGMVVLEKVDAEITIIDYVEIKEKENKTKAKNETADKEKTESEKSADDSQKKSEAEKSEGESSGEKEAEPTESESTGEKTESEKAESETNKAESESAEAEKSEKTEEKTESAEGKTEEKTQDKPVERPKKAVKRVKHITLQITPLEQLGMTEAQFDNSRKTLREIQARIEIKKEREREKNTLEAYIYENRDKLETEAYQAVTTEEQREQFLKDLSEAEEWLYDQPADSVASIYTVKLAQLRSTGDKINLRVREQVNRPAAVDTLKAVIQTSREIFHNVSQVLNITEEELKEAYKVTDQIEEWLNTKVKEQEALAPSADPAFLSTDVQRKMIEIEKYVKRLSRKPLKKKPVETTEAKTDAPQTEAETADSTGTPKAEGEATPQEEQKVESQQEEVPVPPTEEPAKETKEEAKEEPEAGKPDSHDEL